MQKIGHHQITGTIHLLSGLRIGGSDELLDIGATDLTVIKHPDTFEPYIPGSSLKGKMRSQLELQFGLCSGGEPYSALKANPASRGPREISQNINELKSAEYLVAAVFGPHKNTSHRFGPTRILVRDGYLRGGGHLETKPEVMSNRATQVGVHPRKLERVAADSRFRLKIDLQVFDVDRDHPQQCAFNGKTGGGALVEFVKAGLRCVELTGLGGMTSRGSGEVEFLDLKLNGEPFTLPATIPTA